MSKVDWSLAPNGATHWVGGMHPWHQNIGTTVFYWSTCGGCWKKLTGFDVDQVNSQYLGVIQERPKQPQAWSGPEDGLPPVGLEIEIKIDFKKAPPYAIITLTELGVDVQKHTPRFQKAKVLYASSKYLVTESCGVECLTPMSCVEIRAIRTTEQQAAEKRETAIREFMDVVGIDCRVTASKAVDAGFKREVV